MPASLSITITCAKRGGRVLALACAIVAALISPATSGAAVPHYEGVSANGAEVFFTTTDQLVPADTDAQRDIYMRSFDPSVGEAGEYVTREISVGPKGGNDVYSAAFDAVSPDGTRVFFTTAEPLVAEDTDRSPDVYMREPQTGRTSLVSVGQEPCKAGCGNPSPASFAGIAANGNEVFFATAERLVEGDQDSAVDVYERNLTTGETVLVSTGAASCQPGCGNGNAAASLAEGSSDGTRAFFTTTEQLSTLDTDEQVDIYARSLPAGPTELISQGAAACQPQCGHGNEAEQAPIFAGSSADGTNVFFESSEALVLGDTDNAKDVYVRAGGETLLASGGSEPVPATVAHESNGLHPAISGTGNRVLFNTIEPLSGSDTNAANDLYEWAGGGPVLFSSACAQTSACSVAFNASAADATKAVFTTTAPLVPADTDSSGADIYEEESGSAPTLVSVGEGACTPCGNGGANANFAAVSTDGTRVAFSTSEALSTQDTDTTEDVYSRNLLSGETTLVSPAGACPVSVEKSSCKASFVGASPDGTRVFFQTVERVTTEDEGSEVDIYETELGGEGKTRLVTRRNSVELEREIAPEPPVLEGTKPGSPNLSTEPAVFGRAEGVKVQLYEAKGCTGPAIEGTVAGLESPGITAAVEPGTTTTFSAIAIDEQGNASACSNSVSYTAETPPPPPPPTEESGGSGGGGNTGGGPTGGGTSGGTTGGSGAGSTGSKSAGGLVYVAPELEITFGPAFKTRKRKVVFRFADATGQPGTNFYCRVDRTGWRACGSPKRLSHLQLGKHVFSVKAVNAVGTWAPRVVKRSFKVVR